MIVAGVMSGTSADGINVAFVRIKRPKASRGVPGVPRFTLLAHSEFPFPDQVRRAVLETMNAPTASVGDLARLNIVLGELYAEAVVAAQRQFRLKADLVGCHGQTIYHQGEASWYAGRKVKTTWQTGEGAVVASRVGIPVVSDFRPADMAAGGKGAPLVPYLDFIVYRDLQFGRIAQNIGGIANLTAIPPRARIENVIAFDTGPGNMVIDGVTTQLFHRPYDRDGEIAASGNVLEKVVKDILSRGFFRMKPPKTAGREEFGREFVSQFLASCGDARKQDVVATATALTARSIGRSLQKFVVQRFSSYSDFIVSGGGTRNQTLLAMLKTEVEKLGLQVRLSDEFGLPSQAKEAIAFAVMAYQTWHRRPSNVPSATGAQRPAILGKISYA
jgi:anhydro-N-acetylmuramic acid kinase